MLSRLGRLVEEEEEVEEVDGHHQQELPLGPHCFTATNQSLLQQVLTDHFSHQPDGFS